MSDPTTDDFAAMLAASNNSTYRKGFTPGDKVSAYVISAKGNYLILDVKGKDEGIVPIAEAIDADGDLTVNPGDTIDVTFVGVQHGNFIFTLKNKITGASADSLIQNAFDAHLPVDGVVQGEHAGGYDVMISGSRAFCPYSQIDLYRKDGAEYIGQKFTFMIIEFSEDERGVNLIVSRRALLEKERNQEKEKLFADLAEGQTRKGTVTRIVDFGIFVELGGAEGLVPLREMSWQRGIKPEELCKPGDPIEVMVTAFDTETGRISLSIKNLEVNPWDVFNADYKVGDILTGTIVRIENFGAFVQLIKGVDGLLSNGRLAQGKRIKSARDVVSEGQQLEVQIESIDIAKRQVGLKLIDHRFDSLKGNGGFMPGHEVQGIVESIQPFGVFVKLSETETGLLHISETGVPKSGSPLAQLEHNFEQGSTIKVVIKDIDGKRISLTTPTKWAEFQSVEAEGDPRDWIKENNAKNDSFGSLGSAFDGFSL